MFLIGYDIGSSSIKAALINATTNQEIGVVQYPQGEMDMIARRSGWAEQHPEVWWQGISTATRQLLSTYKISPNEIKGIGISYQMHGLVLIDKNQNILRPSIIWCDSRAVNIGRDAFRDLGQDWCLQHCLNSPGNFTASKLKWVKDNEPEIYERIDKILLPGDYIAMKLTGEVNSTISGLSEAILWDFQNRSVNQKLLDYYGFSKDILPKTVPTFSIQGKVTRRASIATGLQEGTPVSYRAGDQPNNALSLNVLNPGEIAATSGTSGVVYGIVNKPLYDTKSRVNGFAHVNYEANFDRIGVLLCLNGAGIQYSWMKHQVARSSQSYQDMERMVSSVPIGSDGICILPFGNGAERILNNQNIHAHILNLDFNTHSRGYLYRAALEGVAFSFVYGVNILKEMGLEVNVIRVGNDNMFQSPTFSKTIATLLDCDIEVVSTTGAIGAARAAGVAVGVYSSLEEALSGIQPNTIYEPSFNQAQYQQAYSYWETNLKKILRKETNRKSSSLNARVENLEEQLAKANKRLAISSVEVGQHTRFLEQLKTELNKIDQENTTSENAIQKIISKIDRQLEDTTAQNEFSTYFNLLNDDFIQRLKSKFPKLTTDDLQLAAFLKMNLPTKDIAQKLHLSQRGVETRRYRLRKKLGLAGKRNFDEIFEQL